MILRLLFWWLIYAASQGTWTSAQRPVVDDVQIPRCLTGYMTDIQPWVDHEGNLTPAVEHQSAIDVSAMSNVVQSLQKQMSVFWCSRTKYVKFLSLAKCKLKVVPLVFDLKDNQGRTLYETAEYITFYGNEFGLHSTTGERYDMAMNATQAREITADVMQRNPITWSNGFQSVNFTKLRELDLRFCGIKVLGANVFRNMRVLERLYLGENFIFYVDAHAFKGLRTLIHLDISRNIEPEENGIAKTLVFETMDLFKDLVNLSSLDLSFTKLTHRNVQVLRSLGRKMERLSLCHASISRTWNEIFNKTSMRYLDISGNIDILSNLGLLNGTEKTLQVLFAEEIGLKNMNGFEKFKKLEVLKVSNNEISSLSQYVAKSLQNLQILDLDKNRLTTWFKPTISLLPSLKLLSLRDNNINIISKEMAEDFHNVSYISLSGNFIVCNCQVREIYELARRNEIYRHDSVIAPLTDRSSDVRGIIPFHIGYLSYNIMIGNRRNVSANVVDYDKSIQLEITGNFLLLDYDELTYQCLIVSEGKTTLFSKFPYCSQTARESHMPDMIRQGWNRLLLLLIPAGLLPLFLFFYIFRRLFRYCFITVRNSAMLSLINKDDVIDDGSIFNYDVFVSYCNEDRTWVLDHLLPHVEIDCNISVCLHERDFQVGLSILENIVSCMDRSRSIMLVISKRFLLSQWCQFEMHLAQHRLLETRREDLILILLEDIPRRLRPNTLHYLMLTKTYIVWPKEESQQNLFWKRMKKSLVVHTQKQEKASLA